MTEETAQLEGFISVTAALQGRHRQIRGIQIRTGKEDSQTRRLERIAQNAGILVQRVSADEIEHLASGKTTAAFWLRSAPTSSPRWTA